MPHWIQTYTGKRFFLAQETTSLSIEDIATPLSRIPRFVGACNQNITVAEHSCVVADIVHDMRGSQLQQLHALLHDAHEMVFGDVPKPVKDFLKTVHGCDLDKISAPYQAQIEVCLGVDPLAPADYTLIKRADIIALSVERRLFMPGQYSWPEVDAINPPDYYDGFYACWEADEARQAFLKAYATLQAGIAFDKRIAEFDESVTEPA
jgi:hypothetical protein